MTAATGFDPLKSFTSPLEQIRIAVKGVPCVRDPLSFDPGLGPTPPEDATPTFAPQCPGDPPVGRFALARKVVRASFGRPANVELHWTSPRSWRDLRVVRVVLYARGHALATLRFDQGTDRLTLARGTRPAGSSLAVGTAGTLSAGRLRVRLDKQAILGSGPRGHSVRLRFQVIMPRSAGPAVVVAVGAGDDGGLVQQPVAAGVIRLTGKHR